MKTKNRLLAFLAIIAFAIGLSASSALAVTTNYYSTSSGDWTGTIWNTAADGSGTTVAGTAITYEDNVYIQCGNIVTINTFPVEINSLYVGTATGVGTGTAILQPDINPNRVISINGDLYVGQSHATNVGKIYHNNGFGYLSWTFAGATNIL